MKLTPDQNKALKTIYAWLKKSAMTSPMFSLSGWAGTGKTTLIQHLINSLDKKPICCAPTGKAASVLQSKLIGIMVKTVHQILYVPVSDSLAKLQELEAKLAFLIAGFDEPGAETKGSAALRLEIAEERARLVNSDPKFTIKPDFAILSTDLIIVDESSMVSPRMLEDFLKLNCKVLFVGDGGQLPPVNEEAWFINRTHDANLTTIVRQAADNPIIRMSQEIREGTIKTGQYNDINSRCSVMNKADVPIEMWMKADQVLTGKNESRRRLNRFFRKQLGRNTSELPVEGDKMICMKNDHYRIVPWVNGVMFRCTGPTLDAGTDQRINCDYGGISQQLQWYTYHCQVHYQTSLTEEPRESRRGLFEADYAYAITVHKSQGSEFPFVVVADDDLNRGQIDFRKRWLYTAVTRAQEKVILVIN